jgi:predicted helicase
MPFDFEAYLRALASTPLDAKTEHTDRGALELLLKAAASDADPNLGVQHEPRRDKGGGGSPDYKIQRDARIVGYVEVKTIDEALGKIIRSDQIKKYQKLSGNLLVTDYLDFIWLKDGETQRARLAYSDDLSARKLALKPENVEQVAALLRGFFSSAPQNIGRGQTLAVELATRAAMLRGFLAEELIRQTKQNDQRRLHALFAAFRDQVFHDLSVADFADAFGQMLTYGLFLARLNAGENQTIDLGNVRKFIPGSFSLIRELVRFLEEMNEDEYKDARWIVDEILSIVNGIDLAAIQNDLSFRSRKAISRKVRAQDEEEHRLFERDPFIYFYEDFLKAYDPAMRKSRGVYYTPPPVVNFIVRAVDDILKDTFGIRDGLADHNKVTVLDFACGTGTFLLEVFERIFDTIGGPQAGRADGMVREHLTKNIFGFEYLIAPYTIAHLKLSQYLRDKGHPLRDHERLQVFLTNTLEPVEPQGNLYLPALAEEVKGAQAIKDKPILVITGNPPYSGHSKNKGAWITAAIDGYKYTVEVDEAGREFRKPLGERNPKWLNDDYVKFMRFAQMKMDVVEEGIVAIITNHSWLDNPTFRGMRQSLMRSFDQIYVLDLHGNAKKKEHAPDGSKDENVFDIEQGVAVGVFVKKPGLERGVWRGDIWGKRLHKYKTVFESNLDDLVNQIVDPNSPHYRYELENQEIRSEYDLGISIPSIFIEGGTGIITKRDSLTIHHSHSDVWNLINRFSEMNPDDARREFRLPADVRDWKVVDAQADINLDGPDQKKIRRVRYRPFDDRFTYYTGRARGFLGWPVERISKHFERPNVGLITSRLTKGEEFRHVQISDLMNEVIVMSSVTSNNGFTYPLWLYDDDKRSENIDTIFRDMIDAKYNHHYSPEEILGYLYAVLHSPSYRFRYKDFLRIDFPKIRFSASREGFEALSSLGWALIQVHLFKIGAPMPDRLADYIGKGDHVVDALRYSPEEQTIWINRTQGFANVPQDVWDFHIGGYQVLEKYLKSRKGRALSLGEQTHVGKVAEALAFTITQMARIDEAYLAAFPDVHGYAAPLAPQA